MKQETIEEIAESRYGTDIDTIRGSNPYDLNADLKKGFIAGAKWQQEKMFDVMQQYAAFCVKCDREKLPLLFAKEWFELFKK